jgi:NYN domain
MPERMTRLALLIDAENIEVALEAEIIAHAKAMGDLNIVRIFGDFTEARMTGWLEAARAKGYQPTLQFNGGRGKNSTDIALTIDAMDILHSGAVEAFCIVSDDRDFLPLAIRLRAAGRRVFAICKTADERMRSVCTDVIALKPKVTDPPIVTAFRAVSGSALEMTLSQAGLALRRHAPELMGAVGKGKLRKVIVESGRFVEIGSGPGLRIRLKG